MGVIMAVIVPMMARRLGLAAPTLGLAVVLYLGYASFFVVGKLCPLCLTMYVSVIGTFALMFVAGHSIDNISLLALTLAVAVVAVPSVVAAAFAWGRVRTALADGAPWPIVAWILWF